MYVILRKHPLWLNFKFCNLKKSEKIHIKSSFYMERSYSLVVLHSRDDGGLWAGPKKRAWQHSSIARPGNSNPMQMRIATKFI